MNETTIRTDDPASVTEHTTPPAADAGIAIHPLRRWLRVLLAGNPFYLASAALVLWGAYRLTVDPHFFPTEISQLAFNFGSLQAYEWLLVGTAVFLARRWIWYDSTLLVCLENLLLFAPFILIGQAVFLEHSVLAAIGVTGCAFAIGRGWALKRFIARLNAPSPLLACALAFLGLHLAFPIAFRAIHSQGDALSGEGFLFGAIRQTWILLLPAVALLPNLLARPTQWGGLPQERSWLPLAFVNLWVAATAVHLAAIGYVHGLPWQWNFLLPAAWASLWTWFNRLTDLTPAPARLADRALLMLPVPAAWTALAVDRPEAFLVFTGLNTALYALRAARNLPDRLAGPLAMISLCSLIAGVPEEWGVRCLAGFGRGDAVAWSVGAGLLLWLSLSRRPTAGLCGALVVGASLLLGLRNYESAARLVVQLSLVYLLLHSLRWTDAEEPGAAVVRWMSAGGWAIASWNWPAGQTLWDGVPVWGGGLLVLAAVSLRRLMGGSWRPLAPAAGAVLALMAAPVKAGGQYVGTAPAGLIALTTAFALFGMGTLLALRRERWNSQPVVPKEAMAESP
jgi:hypothetical protein